VPVVVLPLRQAVPGEAVPLRAGFGKPRADRLASNFRPRSNRLGNGSKRARQYAIGCRAVNGKLYGCAQSVAEKLWKGGKLPARDSCWLPLSRPCIACVIGLRLEAICLFSVSVASPFTVSAPFASRLPAPVCLSEKRPLFSGCQNCETKSITKIPRRDGRTTKGAGESSKQGGS
jgi:hypothetical protein